MYIYYVHVYKWSIYVHHAAGRTTELLLVRSRQERRPSSSPKHPSRTCGKPNLLFNRQRCPFLRRQSGRYVKLTQLNNMPSLHIQGEHYLCMDTESNPDIAPPSVHSNLWRRVEGGGKSECYIIESCCSQTSMGAKWRWRYIEKHSVVVWLYEPKHTGQHELH